MLGCQDFCGYYDWTFHFVHRNWGQSGVELLWRKAVGGESQRHYADAATQAGLRGLYQTWVGTGEDENCDWTFSLDEEKNVLRWDMRNCPSKGFLTLHDLNADEDYCNHCMGWIIPLLESVGVEIVEHEHNHCGQCWATMRIKDRTSQPLHVAADIRNDPRWRHGYLDRWENNRPTPLNVRRSGVPPLLAWRKSSNNAKPSGETPLLRDCERLPHIVTDAAYNDPQKCSADPAAVLIGSPPADLAATAGRYLATAADKRPLLLHAYLPSVPPVDFPAAGLPRPLPILPLLIRRNQYVHHPGGPHPTSEQFVAMLINLPSPFGRGAGGEGCTATSSGKQTDLPHPPSP
jgi:hypothetical protein